MRLGVIGQGFVGSAVSTGFRQVGFDVSTYDKYLHDLSTDRLSVLVEKSDIIFVCVPTPSDAKRHGACDTSIVESVLDEIAESIRSSSSDGTKVIVIKSTIPPGTTEMLQTRIGELCDVVFNPEFLNARSALQDFVTQDHVIIGGDPLACERVGQLYTSLVPGARIECTSACVAETVKYVKNCFFATKVSFFNEMYQICNKLGISYDEMIELAKLDDRVGWEHTRVPGPSLGAGPCVDRRMLGFGGVCLSKDIQAFQVLARQLGIDPKVMNAAWEKNLEVRPERDWEYLSGCVTN